MSHHSNAWAALEQRQLRICVLLHQLDTRIRQLQHRGWQLQNRSHHQTQEVVDRALQLVRKNLNHGGEVLNMYYWGSRWYGTAHEGTADWDFLAIVTGYQQPAVNNVVEEGDIDVSLWEVSVWENKLDQHVPWALQMLYYNEEGIVLESRKFHMDIRLPKLKKALGLNTEVNLRQAKGFWRDGDIRKSKKRVFYVLQIVTLMTQLVQHGTIIDKKEVR